MWNPHGMSRRSPGARVTGSVTAAGRSNPAASAVMRSGRGRSEAPGARLILTVIGLLKVVSPMELAPPHREALARVTSANLAAAVRPRGGILAAAGALAYGAKNQRPSGGDAPAQPPADSRR